MRGALFNVAGAIASAMPQGGENMDAQKYYFQKLDPQAVNRTIGDDSSWRRLELDTLFNREKEIPDEEHMVLAEGPVVPTQDTTTEKEDALEEDTWKQEAILQLKECITKMNDNRFKVREEGSKRAYEILADIVRTRSNPLPSEIKSLFDTVDATTKKRLPDISSEQRMRMSNAGESAEKMETRSARRMDIKKNATWGTTLEKMKEQWGYDVSFGTGATPGTTLDEAVAAEKGSIAFFEAIEELCKKTDTIPQFYGMGNLVTLVPNKGTHLSRANNGSILILETEKDGKVEIDVHTEYGKTVLLSMIEGKNTSTRKAIVSLPREYRYSQTGSTDDELQLSACENDSEESRIAFRVLTATNPMHTKIPVDVGMSAVMGNRQEYSEYFEYNDAIDWENSQDIQIKEIAPQEDGSYIVTVKIGMSAHVPWPVTSGERDQHTYAATALNEYQFLDEEEEKIPASPGNWHICLRELTKTFTVQKMPKHMVIRGYGLLKKEEIHYSPQKTTSPQESEIQE
jgi:hypothetical protein